MTINGNQINPINFFPDINSENISDEEPVFERNKLNFKDCNISANIPTRHANAMFDDFEGPSFKNKIKDFAINPKDRNVILFGQVGTGKTHLLSAAMHERFLNDLEAGYYFNIRTLMPKLRSCRSFSSKETEEMFLNFLCSVPFLCLDEIGTCPNFEEESDFLATVYFCRHDKMLPTFSSTNLSPNNFKLLICGVNGAGLNSTQVEDKIRKLDSSHPVIDRLKSTSDTYTLTGESFRRG